MTLIFPSNPSRPTQPRNFMQRHKQFITTSMNIMQNTITTSMIAETRKCKTPSKKTFSIRSKCIARTRGGLHSLDSPPPFPEHEPTRIRGFADQTFHRHKPPASPHVELFARQASRAHNFVSCGSICRGCILTRHIKRYRDQRAQSQNSSAKFELRQEPAGSLARLSGIDILIVFRPSGFESAYQNRSSG